MHDLATISQHLFAGMRALDAAGVDVILTRDFGREGLGAAIWDRLLRAAEGRVISV
jgi:L-threonylcarbamoyladenylate synthase